MAIFDKKQSFSRREIKETFRRDSGIIPKTGGKKFYEGQRLSMADKSFHRKYGSEISKQDFRDAVRDVAMAKNQARTFKERREIEKRVNYLKKIGGIK